MTDLVFEAFTPSGTEAPDYSAGLFVGEEKDIRAWVAEQSVHWRDRPDLIRVLARTVKHVTPKLLAELRAAKLQVEMAKQRLGEVEGSRLGPR